MKILIRDRNEIVVFDNCNSQCLDCESKCTNFGHVCSCSLTPGEELRQGKIKNQDGSFFLCSGRSFAKTTNLFKEKLNILINTTDSIKKIQSEIKLKEQERYEKIVHNLKTLNAKSIQDQFDFISQNTLSQNYRNQLEIISKEIQNNPDKAAFTFLKLIKHNADIKTEFTAHEKLSVEDPILTFTKHNIKKVILNVYHSFYFDLKKLNIDLYIADSAKSLIFDYETVRLAFYHLFDNSVKYIKPKSKLNIVYLDNNDSFSIIFEMTSIHIKNTEYERIFADYYSGENVIKSNKQGNGLGMGLIKKALKLNNATIVVKAGSDIEKIKKIEYSINQFIIDFKYPVDY
ncbi:ATP-binding protein [uncultured Dysgonomonas sp.]|uniref:sensor histidine kinase n=1 Tax=uncultured Dysgonomonas sp. TaxID=206096 RepID=UPI002803E717|nr:ATP-binding protein [uncultured Dysgonomonas sp.]